MAKFNIDQPQKPKKSFKLAKGHLIAIGVFFIVTSVLVLGMSLYESFFRSGRMTMIDLPGFHEMKLDTAGLYVGVYQHRGTKPIPIKELSRLDVRVLSKSDYQDVPVLMNSTGQTFDRFGFQGMPLFNFMIETPGDYTLSGIYSGEGDAPKIQAMVFPQTVQNVKQTMIVGVGFFILFLVLGILILVYSKRVSAPKLEVK